MNEALPAVIAAEPIERKMHKALRGGEIMGITWENQLKDAVDKQVLTAGEANILMQVREQVMEIIAVDDFDSDEIRMGQRTAGKRPAQHAA
jgi:acyl-CoA dehydrogenase